MAKLLEQSKKHDDGDDSSAENIEPAPTTETGDLDVAFAFLRDHASLNTEHICMKTLRRKLDWNLVPLMFCIHLTQALDGQLLNYAIIMGLPKDLHLEGLQLNNIASSIKWVHLIACAVVGLYLNKYPVSTTLGWSMMIWGLLNACTAAVQKYEHMLAIRILMGVFDSVFHPVMMLVTSQFYRKDEQIVRFQLWWCSAGFSTIIGALIAYGFQFVKNADIESWRIMYAVLGCWTLVISSWTLWRLPNDPMTAKFLSLDEKVALLRHVATNQTGISNHKINLRQILPIFCDPQVGFLCSMVIITGFSSGISSVFGSTLIKSFGFSSKQATLLTAPVGVVVVIACALSTWVVRREWLQRWSTLAISFALAFIGSCLVAWAPKGDQAVHVFGLYLFAFTTATVGIAFQWNAANIAGHTKRPMTMAFLSASFTIGSIAGPYAVQKKEAPDYPSAKAILVAAKGLCTLLVCLLALYYLLANRSKDKKFGKQKREGDESSSSDDENLEEVWANLTDKERPNFRYVY